MEATERRHEQSTQDLALISLCDSAIPSPLWPFLQSPRFPQITLVISFHEAASQTLCQGQFLSTLKAILAVWVHNLSPEGH